MRMWRHQQTPRVHEPKNVTMWGCGVTNKYIEYMSLRIKGCEDTRLQEPKDMRVQGYKQGHMYLRIGG